MRMGAAYSLLFLRCLFLSFIKAVTVSDPVIHSPISGRRIKIGVLFHCRLEKEETRVPWASVVPMKCSSGVDVSPGLRPCPTRKKGTTAISGSCQLLSPPAGAPGNMLSF